MTGFDRYCIFCLRKLGFNDYRLCGKCAEGVKKEMRDRMHMRQANSSEDIEAQHTCGDLDNKLP